MPAISLVVCVYQQRDLMERLLAESHDCYDELVVVYDGPESEPPSRDAQKNNLAEGRLPSHEFPELAVDFSNPVRATNAARFWTEKSGLALPGSVYELVQNYHGRFFEGPRCFTHECQWPFPWSQCAHDWILLLDSDEFPSLELKAWLKQFRAAPDLDQASGYRCVWPLWDGEKAVTKKYPSGRLFLINRKRIRYFAMGENRPSPDGVFHDLELVLHHRPKRRSYGFRNIFRKDGKHWRRRIAEALLRKPTDLSCWRWENDEWPLQWEQIRQQPFYTAIKRLGLGSFRALRDQWRCERRFFPAAAISGPLYHALICLEFKRQQKRIARQEANRKSDHA